MRKLIASTFISLDGVMQAPGAPEEDPTENFTLGGWTFAFGDEAMDLSAAGFDGKDRELVLGRKTYEIFEGYWPCALRLVASKISKTGVVMCTYVPAGDIALGTVGHA